jgi:hypothetical protein
MNVGTRRGVILVAAASCAACGTASAAPSPALIAVAPTPPPKDDGQPAEGGEGGLQHAAALEQLRVSPLEWRTDRQGSVRILLPDATHWLRVKFWGVRTLAGFRYGKAHHAVVGATVVHVEDETAPGACGKELERQAQPWVDSFEVQLDHDPPSAVTWNGKIVDIDSMVATTATLGVHDAYAVAYGTFPAWRGACLVLGVGIPARSDLERAKAVRDRFVSEVLPKVVVAAPREPKERY